RAAVARVTAPATLDAALRDWAARFGERQAVIGGDARLSFAALDGAADAWAAALHGAGLRRGAHVALLGANHPAWLAAAFGVWRAGATLVPVSTFATARELDDILAHADAEAALVQPRMGERDLAATVAALPCAARLRRVWSLADPPAPAAAPPASPARADDIACILYTSGTTGTAKGVMLSHRAILATVAPTVERGGLTPDDRLLTTLPLFWVAGLVIRALPTLASGCALLTLETFSPAAAIAVLRDQRPTALHLRPPQVGQLLAHAQFDAALLAGIRRGGGRVAWFAPHLDPERVRLITGYGMTETAGYVTALDWRDAAEVRATRIGTPLPGVELRIVEGEVRVRAPGLFSGYYKHAPGTDLDADGFFRTGDIGALDADGAFHFSGRSKDLLRVKGINVSPVEVESVLGAHPAVDSVYVVGLPPDGLEQEVVALVVTRDAAPLPEAALRAHAATALSHYKRPARYLSITRAEVPLGATTKPQRAALAALATSRLRG
ncbi:MAG: class I adenylate-forming enzyme family protein, partial [Deltaproteobacteria bacterium]|nr:class I adenylate-forming enzyme family protein [Deltaproteobacteria bacterium]